MQYKDGRIILPVIEFSVSGNTYNVNGINLSYAVFFVKKDRKKFVLLQPAEYTIQTVGANTNLVIQDSALSNVVAIQVALNITKISSDYNVFGTPDITILKDKYNQLEKDMTNLWEYIKKQGVTSDVMNVDVVLPSIADGETYIMRNGSIEATPLISAEDELQKLLDKLVQNSQGILDGYVELLKNDIENQTKIFFEENKKEFLNKTEVRKEISYATGTEYKGNNIFGTELKSITEGETYYYGTKPYMAIKTELNLSGFIAPDNINFGDITNKNLDSIIKDIIYKRDEYFKNITAIGFYPNNQWNNWVILDSEARKIVITVENTSLSIGTLEVGIKALKKTAGYNLSIGNYWLSLRLFNGWVQMSSASNGTGNYLKILGAHFE